MQVDPLRRTFLTTLLKGSVLATTPFALGGCEAFWEAIRNRPMRRDIATLSASDPTLDIYRAAVAAMKALPSTDPRNWTRQAEIHFNLCPHQNWFFLPWHRAYLLFFEQICRDLTGEKTFALPYWNWTCNPSIPSAFFGPSTNPLLDTTRGPGPAATLPPSWVGPSVMSALLAEPNFLIFGSGASTTQRGHAASGPLESNPHNNVHSWIGGNMGTFMSPLDPVFWCHHNMIDRVWWEWNSVMGFSNTNDPAWRDFRFVANFVQSDKSPVDVVAGAMVLGPLLFYQFDQSPTTACGIPGRVRQGFDAKVLRKFLEEGAKVELRTVRRLQSSGPFEVPVGQTSSRVLRSSDAVALSESQMPKDARVLLRAEVATQPSSGEYFVRVFINRPDATAETSTDDPHYAGTFGFFNDEKMPHPGHDDHGNGLYLVDATETIRRLRAIDRIRTGGEMTVQVVAIPMPGSRAGARTLTMASLQLDLADSITAPAKPFGLEPQR